MNRRHPAQLTAAAPGAVAGLAHDLVAGAETQLPDQTIVDSQVARVRGVPGLATAKKSAALAGQFEYACDHAMKRLEKRELAEAGPG